MRAVTDAGQWFIQFTESGITDRDIASLYREERLDATELSGCNFHSAQYTNEC